MPFSRSSVCSRSSSLRPFGGRRAITTASNGPTEPARVENSAPASERSSFPPWTSWIPMRRPKSSSSPGSLSSCAYRVSPAASASAARSGGSRSPSVPVSLRPRVLERVGDGVADLARRRAEEDQADALVVEAAADQQRVRRRRRSDWLAGAARSAWTRDRWRDPRRARRPRAGRRAGSAPPTRPGRRRRSRRPAARRRPARRAPRRARSRGSGSRTRGARNYSPSSSLSFSHSRSATSRRPGVTSTTATSAAMPTPSTSSTGRRARRRPVEPAHALGVDDLLAEAQPRQERRRHAAAVLVEELDEVELRAHGDDQRRALLVGDQHRDVLARARRRQHLVRRAPGAPGARGPAPCRRRRRGRRARRRI